MNFKYFLVYLFVISIILKLGCENVSEPEIQVIFRNGDFEDGEPLPDYWNRYLYSCGSIFLDNNESLSGSRSIRLECDESSVSLSTITAIEQLIIDKLAINMFQSIG